MLNKKHQILEEFVKKPWKKFTFQEIKKLSGKKSESYVYTSLKKFVKSSILKEERAGNVVLYSLNLSSHKTIAYTSFVLEYLSWNKKHIPYKDLEKIASKIPTTLFTFIITGSYANNTQKKTSDLDVVIICDNTFETKKIYAELKSLELALRKKGIINQSDLSNDKDEIIWDWSEKTEFLADEELLKEDWFSAEDEEAWKNL